MYIHNYVHVTDKRKRYKLILMYNRIKTKFHENSLYLTNFVNRYTNRRKCKTSILTPFPPDI